MGPEIAIFGFFCVISLNFSANVSQLVTLTFISKKHLVGLRG